MELDNGDSWLLFIIPREQYPKMNRVLQQGEFDSI